MLKTMGNGAKPRIYASRRDQQSSMSKAYANSSCATMNELPKA